MRKSPQIYQSNNSYKRISVTPQVIEQLNNLFEFTPPYELREYIIEFYHLYILHEHQSLPYNFKKMQKEKHEACEQANAKRQAVATSHRTWHEVYI